MRRGGGERGTTLVEVLLSVVILGFSVVAISDAYHTGLRALDAQRDEAQVDARLRSRIELLLAEEFAALGAGQVTEVVAGQSETVAWTVVSVDLDGDLSPDPAAKHVTVTLRDRSLEVIVVDTGGWVRKL